MKLYFGAAVLNGPGGAADTPEQFVPRAAETIPCPTTMAVPFEAASAAEAQDKQIMWHALLERAGKLRYENIGRTRPVASCDENRRKAIRRLEALAESLVAR